MRPLPKNYHDIHYKDYVAIMNTIPAVQPDDLDDVAWSRQIHLTTLAILCGVSEAEIENLRHVKVTEMINAIAFMNEPVQRTKNSFKVKSIDELTYDEFARYQLLRADQWNNLQDILSLMLKEPGKYDLEGMSIHDVMQVFFCLSRSTQKYLTRLKYLHLLRLIKIRMMTAFGQWRKSESLHRMSSKTDGGG